MPEIIYKSKAGKILHGYIREMDETFSFHRSRLCKKVNEEDIHYLRRAMKKLKALYRLVEQTDNRFIAKKRFKPVKKIFNLSGELRELQVNQKLISTYNAPDCVVENYSQFYKERRKHLKKQLNKALKNFDERGHRKSLRKVSKVCARLDTGHIIGSVASFIGNTTMQARNFFLPDISEASLHSVRILFKLIGPSLAIMELVNRNSVEKPVVLRYKNIEDKLGYWHDRAILLQSITGALMDTLGSLEKRLEFQKLQVKISAENTVLIQELIPEIKKALNETSLKTRTNV
ncbi:MAG: CHAD domain-containing protein [Bacteroidales bacterium]|nr:CHAD domain-containing protein [Bacteroidales bacterium]